MVIVLFTCGAGVGMMMPNGLKARQEIRKDAYLVVCNERCERRMYGDQFCQHYGAGFFRPHGIYVDSSFGGNVYHPRP